MTESTCSRDRGSGRRTALAMRQRWLRHAWIVSLSLLACGDSPTGIRTVQFASSLGIDLATFTESPSGLFYKDTRPGQGQAAAAGAFVTFFIQGWYADGTELQRRIELRNVRLGAPS
jgi:hypothetical protein